MGNEPSNGCHQCPVHNPPARVSYTNRNNPNINQCSILVIASRGKDIKGKAKLQSKWSNKASGSGLNVDYDVNAILNKFKRFNDKVFVINTKEHKVKSSEAKQVIIDFLQNGERGQVIHYTGHGDQDGDWCFFDGWITFEWMYDQLIKYKKGKFINIYCDCCHSGHWPKKLYDKKLNKNVTKEWVVVAAAGTGCSAYDNEMVRLVWVDGGSSWNGAKLKEAMAKRGAVDFDKGKLHRWNSDIYYY